MNNAVEKIPLIDEGMLDAEFYFESLLEEASHMGLLDAIDVKRLQYECLSLLAQKTDRYNGGESSSIRVEQAQSLLASILFTVGLGLKVYPCPEDAVAALKNSAVAELYQKGRGRINTLTAAAKTVHLKLSKELFRTPNIFYRSTLLDGIGGFFKVYDADFAAQEIHITADYPLYNPLPKTVGIEFIAAYVKSAYYENRFCGCFDPADVHRLLCGADEGYMDLLINLYEQVLTAALGCVIAGTDVRRLDVTAGGIRYLKRVLYGERAGASVEQAAEDLVRRLELPQGTAAYIRNSVPLIAEKIKAYAPNNLERVFYTPAVPTDQLRVSVSFGSKMADAAYRALIEEVRLCRFSADKITLIGEQVHSLADLEDLMTDAELAEEEIHTLLKQLSGPEIAALSQRHPLLSDRYGEREQAFARYLENHIERLSPNGRDEIKGWKDALN